MNKPVQLELFPKQEEPKKSIKPLKKQRSISRENLNKNNFVDSIIAKTRKSTWDIMKETASPEELKELKKVEDKYTKTNQTITLKPIEVDLSYLQNFHQSKPDLELQALERRFKQTQENIKQEKIKNQTRGLMSFAGVINNK
jgi:hypothetical protein